MRLIALKPKWPFLRDTFIELADRINERTANSGDGINVTESPNGFIVSLKKDQPAQPRPKLGITDEGSTASWQQLTVIDSADCSNKYIWYWGTAPVADPSVPPPTNRPISTSADSFIPVTEQ